MNARACLVADDHPALLATICDLLADSGYSIVGPARNGADAAALAGEHRPPFAVVDYHMPRLSGTDLVQRLKEVSPDTSVVLYTAEADEKVAADALAAGVDAIVLKEAPLEDLTRALAAVEDGAVYVDPALAGATALAGRARGTLTERERDVLVLVAEGLTHEEIGSRLQITGETARTHLKNACERLGARNRTQAVATAIRLGLVE